MNINEPPQLSTPSGGSVELMVLGCHFEKTFSDVNPHLTPTTNMLLIDSTSFLAVNCASVSGNDY